MFTSTVVTTRAARPQTLPRRTTGPTGARSEDEHAPTRDRAQACGALNTSRWS